MAKKKERKRSPISLDSGFEMSPGSSSSVSMTSDINKEKSSKRISNTKDELEEMYVSMMNVLNTVKSHDDCGPFLNPVNEKCAPGYFSVIKEPMDISVMESKILLKAYKSRKQFEKDFRKMVNNCEVFNGVGNAYTNMAYSIWRVFNKSMKKHFSKCCSKLKVKKEHSQVEPCSKTDFASSSPQSKLYVCTSNNVDGAIKITIKQTEARVVPRTTLHSVKSGDNGKLCFQIKKELAPNTSVTRKNQNNLSLSYEMRKNELPTRRAALQGPKTNPINPPLNTIRRRKRKKKPVAMKALEALAQAAERALKDAASRSSFDDDTFSSHSNSPIYNSSAFPDLKISTTQSHPADLLHRLYSKTLSDSSNTDKDSNKQIKIEKEDFKCVLESKNDISSIFPSAADTLVFPRNVSETINKFESDCKKEIPVFDLTRPPINIQRCRTKFSDSEESSACESDCFIEDYESLNSMSNLQPGNYPEIKPCQVTLSRLSPRQYYRGNKVRILEKVKEEKKRKKRRSKWNAQAMYRRELRSNKIPFEETSVAKDNKDEDRIVNSLNETQYISSIMSSFSPPPIKEYLSSPEPKLNLNEVSDETNFQQYWGKNNVPPRKRYSSIIAERQMPFEKEQTVKNAPLLAFDIEGTRNFTSLPINMTQDVLRASKCQDIDVINKEIYDHELIEIDLENSEEGKSPATTSLNTFQFENISDSSSDEGYTTNERITPVFHSKNQWYYNSLTSRLFGGEMAAGQYPKSNNLSDELLFGNTPFGNSDLPNEKNGFSFEAQCQRQTDYFQQIKPSFIDFSMLTPLNLEIPLPNHCQNRNANSYYPQNSLRNSNLGFVKTSSSILYNENLNEPADLRTLPYEAATRHSSD